MRTMHTTKDVREWLLNELYKRDSDEMAFTTEITYECDSKVITFVKAKRNSKKGRVRLFTQSEIPYELSHLNEIELCTIFTEYSKLLDQVEYEEDLKEFLARKAEFGEQRYKFVVKSVNENTTFIRGLYHNNKMGFDDLNSSDMQSLNACKATLETVESVYKVLTTDEVELSPMEKSIRKYYETGNHEYKIIADSWKTAEFYNMSIPVVESNVSHLLKAILQGLVTLETPEFAMMFNSSYDAECIALILSQNLKFVKSVERGSWTFVVFSFV